MASFPVIQLTEGEWASEKWYDILGVKLPNFFTSDPAFLRDYIFNFKTRPDDVFVATYPKSGTTWVQEIVWQIYHEGAVSSANFSHRVPFIETATNEMICPFSLDTLPSPRLLKSHLPLHSIPKSDNKEMQCKYIYVARNPKDIAVSYFHFTEHRRKAGNGFSGPWEFYAKLFIEENVCWNAWNDHVLDWWKHRDDPNILFLKYEDLHKDLPSHVRTIADFLKKPLADELIDRISQQCTLKGMRENETSFKLSNEEESSPLLRKGVVGGWESYFTPELNERFEKEVLAKLKGTGLKFDFEI